MEVQDENVRTGAEQSSARAKINEKTGAVTKQWLKFDLSHYMSIIFIY